MLGHLDRDRWQLLDRATATARRQRLTPRTNRQRFVAHLHDVEGIPAAHRAEDRSAIGPTIQAAMSQDTTSICWQRSSPNASRNASTVCDPGLRQPILAVHCRDDDDGHVALADAMANLVDPDSAQARRADRPRGRPQR
jgi:hypothetical protein